MNRRLVHAIGLAVVLFLAPSIAFAQSAITGLVRDTSGAIIPGVTVEVASPVLIEKVRSAVSDVQGRYQIIDLRPGVYTVTFTLAGFNTYRQEGLELPASFTATVNAEMRVGALEESITVTGAAPVVDVQSTQRQVVLNRELMDAVPTARNYSGMASLMKDQEFAETARQVLEVQKYPDLRESPDGPLEQPYDAAGWTLPYQMGVQVNASMTPLADAAKTSLKALGGTRSFGAVPTPYESAKTDRAAFDSLPGVGFDTNATAAAIVPPAGKTSGSGAVLLVDPAQNNAFRAINKAWKTGGAVKFVGASGTRDARYAITGLAEAAVTDLVASLALQAERVASATGADVKKPRIGLYRPWQASIDEGWTRWVLEQYGFDLVNLAPEEVRAGAPLADRVDVLVIADEARGLMDGYASGVVPPRYEGGIGADGVRAIDAFVRGGGTLVCFNRASLFAIDQLHLPVTNVVAGVTRQEFFTGGSILQVETEPGQPVMAGMPGRAPVFVDSSPAFETQEGFKGQVLARYQQAGSPLLSGYLVGEKYLNGKAAALDVQLGMGHVMLLGFRPQWRGQPFGTFRVIFNAVLSGR